MGVAHAILHYMKKILFITIFAIFLPLSTQACQQFSSGTAESYDRTAWGTRIEVAVNQKGKYIRIANKETCERLDSQRFRKRKRGRIFHAVNLWQEEGGENGSPEILVTDRISSRRLKVKVFTITEDFQIELVAKKTVRVSDGDVEIPKQHDTISINNEDWKVFLWKNTRRIAKAKNTVDFINLGDYGLAGDPKDAVAEAMNTVAKAHNGVDFVTTNGDNFYPPERITSPDDEHFQTNFIDTYNKDWLDVPFYISLGNHDYDDNDVEDLLAIEDETGKWQLPDYYYSFEYPADSDSPLLHYIQLDTEMIDDDDSGKADQLEWFENELANSTADWLIVGGHHPAYSYGEHGDVDSIIEDVLPLLQEYNVDVFIAGHEHDKQVLTEDGSPLMIINGAGSKLRDTGEGERTEFAISTYGFMHMSILNDTFYVKVYDSDAQEEFVYELEK